MKVYPKRSKSHVDLQKSWSRNTPKKSSGGLFDAVSFLTVYIAILVDMTHVFGKTQVFDRFREDAINVIYAAQEEAVRRSLVSQFEVKIITFA